MPEALDLTSTLVMGWTLPVATTERAISPFSTLASWEGSSLALLPRAATVTPRRTAMATAIMPPQIQSLRFLLRCVAKVKAPQKLLMGCGVQVSRVWLRSKQYPGSVDQRKVS